MKKEQIKARVCELFEFGEDKWFDYEHEFMSLAADIAATERAACAKVCDDRAKRKNDGYWTESDWNTVCAANEVAADAIRERSNAALRGDSGSIAGVPLESTVMQQETEK